MAGNEAPFNPSQQEIRERCEILHWMQLMEWDSGIIDSIMVFDQPTPDRVRILVYYYGPDEALNRIRRFLEA